MLRWAWPPARPGPGTTCGRARPDLARYHPEEARGHLAAVQKVWPDRPAVRLLASRAARQAGDFAEADRHLRAAYRAAGGPTEEIAFEWALLQAAGGNVWEVDEYLQRRADEDPSLAPLAWEALAEGYLRVYRTLDAMACLNHWLQVDPDNLRARELRGMTYVTGKGVARGAEDYRGVLERDPARDDTRWRLVLCLLDLGGVRRGPPAPGAGSPPAGPTTRTCWPGWPAARTCVGRGAEARQLFDRVLARHPDHAAALRTRGQFALADRDPAEAERWLRRAVAAAPSDYQSHWLLFQALQQSGQADAARDQLQVAEGVKDRTERIGELQSRKLAERPLDPALHVRDGGC